VSRRGQTGAQVRALRAFHNSSSVARFASYGALCSGKTTLLSLLGCLLSPDEGTVFIDGVAVNGLSEAERTTVRQKKISFVFQAF